MNRKNILERNWFQPWLNSTVFVVILIVYLFTLYPGLGLIDSGELTAVSRTLGVAHPTGYPLYTMLGRLITLLPIGSISLRTNLLSALISALGSLFFFLFMAKKIKSKSLALVPTALVAFSNTIWSVSNVTEVYCLTYFFLTLSLYLYQNEHYHLLCYVLGLTLTNHMIGISFVLPIILLLLLNKKITKIHVLFFLLGLSPYLYLPIRSATKPILNWGDPSNIEQLFWHISGKQYRVWMFSLPLSQVLKNLLTASGRFAEELIYVLLPLSVIGIYFRRKKILLFILIMAINIGYSINYSIPDVESYFIPALVVIVVLAGYGLSSIIKKLSLYGLKKIENYLLLLILLPIIHLPTSSGNNYHFADDLANNVLLNMEEGSVLICTTWDVYSPLLYYDIVENVGSNHWLIDKELLRRSWYLNYLKERYPELHRRCAQDFMHFEKHLHRFEHGLPYNKILIQNSFEALIRKIVLSGLRDRPVYLLAPVPDPDLQKALFDLEKYPAGLLTRIAYKPEPFDFSKLIIRLPDRLDKRHRFLISSIYMRAIYLNQRSRSAEILFQKLKRKLK